MKQWLWLAVCLLAVVAAKEDMSTEEVEQQESWNVLLLLVLLFFCFLAAYFLRLTGFMYLHESGAAILFGALIGSFITLVSNMSAVELPDLEGLIRFDSNFFFLVLLPPIIFDSGYNMRRTFFFSNIFSIMMFAFVGTLISALAFGTLLYIVVLGGLVQELTFLECMLFGSLVSATDPVTVLSVFSQLAVPHNLYANVFGESIFNDAVAIVLFQTIFSFHSRPFGALPLLLAVADFVIVFFGSIMVGVVVAFLCCLLFKYTSLDLFPSLEIVFLVIFAYSAYLLAVGLGLSGIVAILFAGITMAHYAFPSLSASSQNTSTDIFHTIAVFVEMFVFAYLGLSIPSMTHFDITLVGFSMVFCLLTRALHVFPLSIIINGLRSFTQSSVPEISLKHQFVIWFSGLRGAIAFALSLQLSNDTVPSPDNHAAYIMSTTLVIVLITVLGMGGGSIRLLKELGIDKEETVVGERKSSVWSRFDRRHIKPRLIKLSVLEEKERKESERKEIETKEFVERSDTSEVATSPGRGGRKRALSYVHGDSDDEERGLVLPIIVVPSDESEASHHSDVEDGHPHNKVHS